MYIFQEIVGDLRDRNIIDIKFIPFNKKKQEIKRSLKLRQLYLVRGVVQSTIFKREKENPVTK